MLIIVTYLSDQAEGNDYRKPARSGGVDQAEGNDYRKPARSGAVDQAEGKGKEEGAVFSAGANWVCTVALT